MTNDEIDLRLRLLSECLPPQYEMLKRSGIPKMEREMELLNMQIIGIVAMLGEIAKRLPMENHYGNKI